MPEIILPTAAKQDDIKSTVEEIASNFPLDVSGGTDFSKGVPKTTKAHSNSSTLSNVVNITGKGILTGIMQQLATTGTDCYLEVILDGVPLLTNERTVSNSSNNTGSVSLSFIHKFNNSLVVKHRVAANNYTVSTFVNYVLT